MKHALLLATAVGVSLTASLLQPPAARAQALSRAVAFEDLKGLVGLRVTVNNTPLLMLLDTGAAESIIDLDTAQTIGLALTGRIQVRGTGSGSVTGAFTSAPYSIDGVTTTPGAIRLAIPLNAVSRRLGRHINGIVGLDFLRTTILEIDYASRVIRTHAASSFRASPQSVVLPVRWDGSGHPVFPVRVRVGDEAPTEVAAKLDVGHAGALTLHAPFVSRHGWSRVATTRLLGAAGVAGQSTGRVGRVSSITVGGTDIPAPLVVFSTDTTGAFASETSDAHLGADVLSLFRLTLDLGHDRVILERTGDVRWLSQRCSAGLVLEANGQDFSSLVVTDVLNGGPAAQAGMQVGDRIIGVAGTADVNLVALSRRFEHPGAVSLRVARGDQTLTVVVQPRPPL